MSKQNDNYRELAMAVGLRYDVAKNVIYGRRGEYEFLVYAADSRYPYMLTIQTTARTATGAELTKAEKKEIVKSIDKIAAMNQKNHTLTFLQRNISKQEKLKAALEDSIRGIISCLGAKGYSPCCDICGQNKETAAFQIGKGYVYLCPDCELRLRDQTQLAEQQDAQKKENVIGGILGAMLGSVFGVLCILILSRLGYVAALSGVAMAIGVLKGYEILGKKISQKGIIISIVIMLIMTYVGDKADWAFLVASEFGENVFDCYRAIPVLVSEGYIDISSYIGNLIILYLFLLLGAVPTIISIVGNQKIKNKIVRVGSYASDNDSGNIQ